MTYTDLALFIDGRFRASRGEGEDVLNPATGAVLAHLPHAAAEDLEEAITASERAFPVWAATPAIERSGIIRRAAALIRERADAIARIMTLEQGKPVSEARGEALYAAEVLEWYAEEGRRAYGRIIPGRVPGVHFAVSPEPVGPAVAFTPWNFPALTPARKIGGALAAGCALILKAAEETPGTAIELVRAFAEAGLPPGVLNLVFGKPETISRRLLASPAIRKFSFTGSTAVGKQLMRLAADNMQRTTFELGGHAPVIICGDADPRAAASMIAQTKYRNAGQVCISPTRFYVHRSIAEPFIDRFVEVAQAIALGDGLEAATTMGPLANERRVLAMEAIVADVRARGGVVRTGSKRHGNRGFFFEPTVVTDIADDALIMTEEPFGPVAPIVPFDDLDDAIARANSLPYGLAAYAFTPTLATAEMLGMKLKAGMVGLNTTAVSNPETPFGGMRESGYGSEGGIEGLQAYFDQKLVAHAG